MFYRPDKQDHGLPIDPFKAVVAPRPIGWISTRGADGRANLAPYSYFNAVSEDPPTVAFGSNGGKPDRDSGKDTLSNIRQTGAFTVNIVSEALAQAMNVTSGSWSAETDEFELAGLARAPGVTVPVPRVAEAPAALECRLWTEVALPGTANTLIVGLVTGVFINDEFIRDGRLVPTLYRPLGRLGYRDYTAVAEVFTLKRP